MTRTAVAGAAWCHCGAARPKARLNDPVNASAIDVALNAGLRKQIDPSDVQTAVTTG